MAKIKPFKGIRPPKDLIKDVASRPYDVLNSEEAREEAKGNEKSLYHIIKPEIDFPVGTDEHDPAVYEKAAENFQMFQDKGWLVQDQKEQYYVYAQTMNGHTQYGLVVCAYVADYLLIGNSSDGYQFVFVELEAPNGRITKEKGTRFGEVINKGIEQVRDWQMYIAANWNVIVAELEKHSFSNTKLPRQLYKYCPYQIYYAVIAGLRKDFENIRDRKLQLQNENNITLLHYENLIDVANEN